MILVPFFTTIGVVAPLKNDPILWLDSRILSNSEIGSASEGRDTTIEVEIESANEVGRDSSMTVSSSSELETISLKEMGIQSLMVVGTVSTEEVGIVLPKWVVTASPDGVGTASSMVGGHCPLVRKG